METTSFQDLRLSRIMLGTAQFGLAYGVANTLGKPDLSSVRAILAAAHECGINCLDTAASYGDSEAVIGQALGELGLREAFTVVTKIPRMAENFSSEQAADEFVEAAAVRSLKFLKRDVLPFCLFHNDGNYRYMNSLLKLQQRGLVRYVGCSLNEPASVPAVLQDGRAQAIQFPASVLDARFIGQGMLKAAPGAALFTRSVYLQGLLLMPEESIPAELQAVIPVRRALQAVARQAGLAPEELYMRYVLTHPGVASLVIGSETAEQVRHNAKLVHRGALDAQTFEAATAAVPELPEFLLMPVKWATRMPGVAPAKA